MGKIFVFDGKDTHKVSSGALAMAMSLEKFAEIKKEQFIKLSEVVTENEELKEALDEQDTIIVRKERQLQELEKELDKYDRVFKKYDRTMDVVMDAFCLLPAVKGVSIKQAVLQTILKIWKD